MTSDVTVDAFSEVAISAEEPSVRIDESEKVFNEGEADSSAEEPSVASDESV